MTFEFPINHSNIQGLDPPPDRNFDDQREFPVDLPAPLFSRPMKRIFFLRAEERKAAAKFRGELRRNLLLNLAIAKNIFIIAGLHTHQTRQVTMFEYECLLAECCIFLTSSLGHCTSWNESQEFAHETW